jgi:hypothetical protein
MGRVNWNWRSDGAGVEKRFRRSAPETWWPGSSSDFMCKDGMGVELLEVNSIAWEK